MAVTLENVIDRLSQLGYIADASDNPQIEYELEKITNYTLNYCNITSVPEIVEKRLIDRVCSEFLFNRKNSGKLEGFDYDTVIKELREGDTTIKYAVGQGEDTPENRFDAMVKQLERGYDKWITPHRRLRW